LVLQCNRALESAFARIERHVPNVTPRIPTTQRIGMGSASSEFPSCHSTTFGDPLRSVEEPFTTNLTFIPPKPPCIDSQVFTPVAIHHTVSVSCAIISSLVSLASGSLRSSSFLSSRRYPYIHTQLAVPTVSTSILLCYGWQVSADSSLYYLHV
jgi:hypothetical protein